MTITIITTKDLLEFKMDISTHNPFEGFSIKMFNFGTSAVQVLGQSFTQIGTSDEQALVSINKHIQTITNNKTKTNGIFLKF